MATNNVKLLGKHGCPFVNRVQMALGLKSIDHEFMEEDPFKKSELLLKSNPVNKKVPVLFHAEKPICESLLIVQYIDEAWPNNPSILPSDPYERATARFWAAYIDEKWFPLTAEYRKSEGEEAKAAARDKLVEGTLLLEEAFISCSKAKSFSSGDNIGYLDIILGSLLGWLKAEEILTSTKIFDETKIPQLVAWTERFCANKAVKDFIPESEKLAEGFKKFEMLKAASNTN
ncbi:PREDICTED: glutathione S-transferase U17-like [Nicotiana attenuata]|uniref:glutathione S-transferase U17-like n=1 Tax=Nicotiana attenuata TaxID=49451 RepID=UPI000905B788|nr:PREDICTED: glutathione S-transferase U17-like [Nicotiana attenuata]